MDFVFVNSIEEALIAAIPGLLSGESSAAGRSK
jgi:hypothetical protein